MWPPSLAALPKRGTATFITSTTLFIAELLEIQISKLALDHLTLFLDLEKFRQKRPLLAINPSR